MIALSVDRLVTQTFGNRFRAFESKKSVVGRPIAIRKDFP